MVQTKTNRVIVADDHDMVRSGLSVFVGTCQDILMVGEAANGSDAIRLCYRIITRY